jgi:thiol-disulfide isomerase/thioredoxin
MTEAYAPSSRRAWLAAGVGVALAAGGAGLVLRRQQQQARALTEVEQTLWQQKFEQLDGTLLPMSSFQGKALILNFWATWCPPCVEELPLLNAFFQENSTKGWQVLGLAVDQPVPVKRFLQQSPLNFPVALAGFAGVELSRSLGNLSGGLPYTVVLGRGGEVQHRKMGRVNPSDLAAWSGLQTR